jgi:hypothetical protein
LGADQRVVSDGAAVAYVDQVVDLGAASDASFAYAGAVDAGVCLDLGIVLQYYVAGLHDFVPAACVVSIRHVFISNIASFDLGEAEAVGAYYGSILEQDVIA